VLTDGDTMPTPIPDNPDAVLTRDATAAALTAAGYPISAKTLSGKATRGGGPPYGLFAGRALYRWGAALVWARSHVTAPPSADASAGETGV
jgi:hypothetical protein